MQVRTYLSLLHPIAFMAALRQLYSAVAEAKQKITMITYTAGHNHTHQNLSHTRTHLHIFKILIYHYLIRRLGVRIWLVAQSCGQGPKNLGSCKPHTETKTVTEVVGYILIFKQLLIWVFGVIFASVSLNNEFN